MTHKDNVNNPFHYNHRGIECIAAIEASMTPEEFLGYLKGNTIKYIWRYNYKNGLEDLDKMLWYGKKLRDKYEEKINAKTGKRQKSNTPKRKTRKRK